MTHTKRIGKTIQRSIPEGESLRPWQAAFWEAMIGKCPGPTDIGVIGQRKFTPEALWDLACLYFAGSDKDTIEKKDFIRSGDAAGKVIEINVKRPYSWTSLELFVAYHGIKCNLSDLRANRDDFYPDFKETVAAIDQVIRQQKFDGAAAGNYNPHLIIRDLGLADKVDASVKAEQPLFVDSPKPPVSEHTPDDEDML